MSGNYIDTRGIKRLTAKVSENVSSASKKAVIETAKKRSDFYMEFDDVEAIPSEKFLTLAGNVPLDEILAQEAQQTVATLAAEFRRALE